MFYSIANFASSLTLKFYKKIGITALKKVNFCRTAILQNGPFLTLWSLPYNIHLTTLILPSFFCVKSVQRTYFLWFSQWMLDRSFTVKCIICKASIPIQLKKKKMVWCDAKDFKCLDSLWSMNHVISKVVKVLNLSKRWSCNLSKLPSRSLLILRKNVVQ